MSGLFFLPKYSSQKKFQLIFVVIREDCIFAVRFEKSSSSLKGKAERWWKWVRCKDMFIRKLW